MLPVPMFPDCALMNFTFGKFVHWAKSATGRSAFVTARKVGVAAEPDVGPARTVFAVCVPKSVAVTEANEGLPAALPCRTVVVVPWLACCAPARVSVVQVEVGAASAFSVKPVTNWFVQAVGVPVPDAEPVEMITSVPLDFAYLPDVAAPRASFVHAGVDFAMMMSPRTGEAATVSPCVTEKRLCAVTDVRHPAQVRVSPAESSAPPPPSGAVVEIVG